VIAATAKEIIDANANAPIALGYGFFVAVIGNKPVRIVSQIQGALARAAVR
jgi:hypothetical protein